MNRRSVLVISHEATRTGAPRIATEIVRTFREDGARVTVLLRWDGPLRGDFAEVADDVRLEPCRRTRAFVRHRLRRSSWANRIDEQIASGVLRRRRPDLVYANTVKAAAYVRPALELGIPVVLHVHELEPLASETLARYALQNSYDRVTLVACSTAVAENLARITGRPLDQIIVAPSAIDPDDVRRRAGSGTTDARSPDQRLVVGACGTVDRRKGVDLWLEATAEVRALRPDLDVEFVWIGATRDDATPMNLPAENVTFTGEIDEPLTDIAAMDLFTLPSRVDPFPLAVLEAMALERPIVAFDVGGVREQIADTAVLVPPEDVGAFAAAIISLLDDPARRRELGAAARARVDAKFNLGALKRGVLQATDRAWNRSSAPASTRSFLRVQAPVQITAREVVILNAFEAERLQAFERDGQLPYRIEKLVEHGVSLTIPRGTERPPWNWTVVRRAVRSLERIGAPFLQTLLAAGPIGRADAVLAMFESQANALAVLRRLRIPPFTRPRFVVVSCWLASEIERAGVVRRRVYRWAYQSVDALVFFSENQREIFVEALGVPAHRLHSVDFGIDDEFFSAAATSVADGGDIVAVGRDGGRDWETLVASVRDTDLRVVIAARPGQLAGIELPENVVNAGYIDRARYRDLLAQASVVAVITKDLSYPTGQSVLLEAMALGKCCVVTETSALAEYVRDGVDCLTTPLGDPAALRHTLELASHDQELRRRLGREAHERSNAAYAATGLWNSIAELI